MKFQRGHFLILSTLFAASFSMGDPAVQEASQKVQQELKDPQQRQKLITTPEAKSAIDGAGNLAGGDAALQEEIIALAADLIPTLQQISGNDPAKMAEYLEQVKRDPASFASRFPAAQQEQLRKIAEKIAQKNKKNP